MKKIVIIGAGYAGVLAAKKIAKSIGKRRNKDDFEVAIIDKNPFQTMLTELHEVAAQRVEEDSVKISLERVFAGRRVQVIHDEIVSIDYHKKNARGKKAEYKYDCLVLATGSKPTYFGLPGAQENAFPLWSYHDAVRLREHIMTMFREASCDLDRETRREKLTFFVAGAGFTGVEMAGELAELVPVLCKRFEIDRSEVSIKNVDILERICPVLPEKQAAKVERRLKKMHVDIMLKTGIKEVGPDYVAYTQGQDTIKVNTRTVIWTAGIEGSDLVQASSELPQAGRGRVKTDTYLRALDHPDVYVAGDNIFYTPEGKTGAVPQMVENAEASAETIAHNVLVDMTQTGEKKAYNPVFHGVMVCVGGRYGQATIGLSGKLFSLPSFLAMFVKHFINIIYFIKTLGWNKAFSYMNHEFFQVRNKRSFVGGHFSNRSATFMLVPLRVYLGAYWIYEGMMKILFEGWLSGPKLADFFNGANAFYDSVLNAAAATTGASVDEAVAGASETAAGALSRQPEALLNVDIFRCIRLIFIDCGEAASNAFKMQTAPIDWVVNTLVLSSDMMQNLMQQGILFAEILVGLALISGLFTTAAGAVSLALQFMFLTTTGLYMSTWWMLFASMAVMFGAGRVLSLDYYVMPALGRRWAKLKFVKQWYLYNDGL